MNETSLPKNLLGFMLTVTPDIPKYVLPKEVIPGVGWPEGFRQSINKWSVEFLGTTNILKDDQFLVYGEHCVANPRTMAKFASSCAVVRNI